MKMAKPTSSKTVDSLTHEEAKRKNIPTAEYQSVLDDEQKAPKTLRYPRNTDLDPQLVWRGKDEQDWSDLVVHAPPLYIQDKVHPKVLIDDLLRSTKEREHEAGQITADLFADFNGIPKGVDKTEFYQHDQNWTNRMILGDSLQVMASLAEREGLRGKVQCIYFDPPYGIKFNSNFQWSTTSRDVRGARPTTSPASRNRSRHSGIHGGTAFIATSPTCAIGSLSPAISLPIPAPSSCRSAMKMSTDVRAVMDEVFGEDNFVAIIVLRKKPGYGTTLIEHRRPFVVVLQRQERERSKTSAKKGMAGERDSVGSGLRGHRTKHESENQVTTHLLGNLRLQSKDRKVGAFR